MHRAVAVVLVLAGALFLGACGGGEDDEADTRAVSTTERRGGPIVIRENLPVSSSRLLGRTDSVSERPGRGRYAPRTRPFRALADALAGHPQSPPSISLRSQDVQRSVAFLDDCLHRDRSSMHSIISCRFRPSLQRRS